MSKDYYSCPGSTSPGIGLAKIDRSFDFLSIEPSFLAMAEALALLIDSRSIEVTRLTSLSISISRLSLARALVGVAKENHVFTEYWRQQIKDEALTEL